MEAGKVRDSPGIIGAQVRGADGGDLLLSRDAEIPGFLEVILMVRSYWKTWFDVSAFFLSCTFSLETLYNFIGIFFFS